MKLNLYQTDIKREMQKEETALKKKIKADSQGSVRCLKG